MRLIEAVITQMLAVIPEEETELRDRLATISTAAAEGPPEMQPHWWIKTDDALRANIHYNGWVEWRVGAVRIFTGGC